MDRTMSKPHITRQRRKVLKSAVGEVFEIGMGTGLNLPHYPEGVSKIVTVDPNPGMSRYLEKRSAETVIPLESHVMSGENLPFEDNRFDCAVSTWTLCSIADLEAAIREIYRILKPGGRFLFLEHGLSPDARVARWQNRLNGLQKLFADGCHLNRDMRSFIMAQPFEIAEIDNFYIEKTPRPYAYMYRGVAIKRNETGGNRS
jgi:ubiquinone/menaquinone biosynthesis C-methylase UbiE